jgi:hypothetical protein
MLVRGSRWLLIRGMANTGWGTWGHGLNVHLMIMIKARDSVALQSWFVSQMGLGTNARLFLNSTECCGTPGNVSHSIFGINSGYKLVVTVG